MAYAARHSFAVYCELASPWPIADHQWGYAAPIITVDSTPGARQIVTGAPQHGKTTITTLRGLEWMLGRGYVGLNDISSAMIAAYNQTRASDLCAAVRDAFRNPRSATRLVFPECELEEPAGQSAWCFRGQPIHEPTLSAYGVGGGTGYPAQLIIIDDYVKGIEEAQSEAYQRHTWNWWVGTIRPRMQVHTRILVTATRWLENDLPGRLLASEEAWNYRPVPAIRYHEDGAREARWPERFPLSFLDEQLEELGARQFATLYQCDPTPEAGILWQRSWFDAASYEPGHAPLLEQVWTAWDTAFSTKTSADYTAWVRAGIDALGGYWLLSCGRRRMEFPDLIRAIEGGAGGEPDESAVIEDAASGKSAIQAIRRDCSRPVVPMAVDADKAARARAVSPIVEGGRAHLPRDEQAENLIRECVQFPNGSHDDLHDAFVHSLAYYRRKVRERGTAYVRGSYTPGEAAAR